MIVGVDRFHFRLRLATSGNRRSSVSPASSSSLCFYFLSCPAFFCLFLTVDSVFSLSCCCPFLPKMASAVTKPSTARKETILSRRYIEGQIAEGKHMIIYDDRVLKVDSWLPFHPGGEKTIKHMVGRDATDEMNVYV